MAEEKAAGSRDEFHRSWLNRPERSYLHWTRAHPTNQIQLAFRQNWLLFRKIIAPVLPSTDRSAKALEVGSGRGSMSMYFADAGFDCTLLDTSTQALITAKELFSKNSLVGNPHVGDALALPLRDDTFEVVFSIGLLEHFEQIEVPLAEQVRVLKPGGWLLVYVVPENPNNVQSDFEWVNEVLRIYAGPDAVTDLQKEETYRSTYEAPAYRGVLEDLGLDEVTSTGVYPLPMISPSPRFPFTLNPPEAERALVAGFEALLSKRPTGWLCEETYGQAFLVSGRKR